MKFKIKIITLLYILCIIIHPAFSKPQKFLFTHLSTTDGLPNNRVHSILQDSLGFLWFGTLDGLSKYDGYQFINYRNNPDDSTSIHSNRVTFIYEDKNHNLWLNTKNNGINRFDPYREIFKHYTQDPNDPNAPLQEIDCIFEDNDHGLVLQSLDDYCVYNRQTDNFTRFAGRTDEIVAHRTFKREYRILLGREFGVSETQTISWLEEKGGIVWIGTQYNGIFIYDPKAENVYHYTYDPIGPTLGIETIYQDRAGIIWIGTNDNGVFKHDPLTRRFTYYNNFHDAKGVAEKFTVKSLTEDFSGNIWVGTEETGLIRFNPQSNGVKVYKNKPADPHSLTNDRVLSLYTDYQGKIWAGTWAGISIYNPEQDNFDNITFNYNSESGLDLSDSTSLCFNRVCGFCDDQQGNMWIANWDVLAKYNKRSQVFKHYDAKQLGVDNIRNVFIDSDNQLWICCEFGGLLKHDLKTGAFTRFYPGKSKNSLIYENVFDVHEDSKGNIWIATFNGLDKFDKSTGVFHHFSTNDGLASNMLYQILEDGHDNIWLATIKGISRFDPDDNSFKNYDDRNGIVSRVFADGGFYQSKKTGRFIVGSTNGIVTFHPDDIVTNPAPPSIAITKLQILNNNVGINEKIHNRIILNRNISYTKEIALNHQHRNIIFEFSALHYTFPDKNQYAYKMEGLDDDWNYCGNRRFITYPGLDAGDYIFRVKASNSDGVWNESGSVLKISMSPPWWLTWWAYSFYIFLIGSIIYLLQLFLLKRQQLQHDLQLEHVRAEQLEETNRMKSRFYSYIAHEFRTPLTMIMGPLQQMLVSDAEKARWKQFRMMLRNSKQMMMLINQLLDLTRLESGKMELQAGYHKLNPFLKRTVLSFSSLAEERGILLNFFEEQKDIMCYFDRDKLEKVIYNLLSNALKFTNEGGKVSLTVSLIEAIDVELLADTKNFTEGVIEILVRDTGIGIEKERLPHIFKQFYQADTIHAMKRMGTGIGLALVKELVELHHGQIHVDSTPGKGSEFIVFLPHGKRHLKPVEIISDECTDITEPELVDDDHLPLTISPNLFDEDASEGIETEDENESLESLEKPIVLVVDDSAELRSYIKQNLISDYIVKVAEDGAMGVKAAFDLIPDLIISDVIMPEMDGFELCRILKSDLKTCHIPIILLTAKSSDESKLDGLEAGAIEYLLKPFNPIELHQRIDNLIELRRRLQEKYKKEILLNPAEIKAESMDEQFLEKVCKTIDKFISEPYFTAEKLQKECGMSYSNFYRKIRALTSQSPNQFMRSYKLKRAAQLLQKNAGTVIEIAYEVGFSNCAYFAECFKKQFGILPSKYRKSMSAKKDN